MELDVASYIDIPREDFDSISPWKDIRRVALSTDKQVMGVHDKDNTNLWNDGSSVNWTTYESSGWNCMVQIPKFYYKTVWGTVDGKRTIRWYVSDTPTGDFKVHPAFIRNGVEKDYIYFSAFEGSLISGKLRSLPNKTVTASRTIVQFRGDAQANGSGWEQQDFLATCAVQLLYSLEYGHFDSQSKLGGRTNESARANTGLSLGLGNKSSVASNNTFMSYRGIENFYGNYNKWVDGININNRNAYVADSDYASDKFDGNYRHVGFTNVAENGTVSDIGLTEDCDFAFLGTAINGSTNDKGLYDYGYYNYTGARVARFGGNHGAGLIAGAFCWLLNYSAADSDASLGTRLSCS